MHVPWLSKQMFSKERPCPRMDNGGKRFPVRPPVLVPVWVVSNVQCASKSQERFGMGSTLVFVEWVGYT
jgi:hypothetical protein